MTAEKPTDPRDLPPPEIVQDAGGLRRLLGELSRAGEIAIDTEADSFFHYQERVCLIQLTAAGRDWLVDPLGSFDLAALGEVLADPGRKKVFHDGEYDVLILKRDFGWSFANLFDTRVAVAALGSKTPGLAAVLSERFGVDLDKSLQRSDWSRRPLTSKQVDYARLDTHYLLPLMRELLPELERTNRLRIVEGECRRLEALEPPDRAFDPDEFLRLKGARTLSRADMAVLRELFVLRDRLARERDLPPFKILANPTLLELARAKPRTPRGFARIPGLSPKLARRFGAALLEAVARGRDAGPLQSLPRLAPRDGTGGMDEVEVELHERLKTWRRDRATADDLDGSLILNRKTLLDLARRRPRARDELAGVEGLLPWQADDFGEELLDVVRRFEADLEAGRVSLRGRRGGRSGDAGAPERRAGRGRVRGPRRS